MTIRRTNIIWIEPPLAAGGMGEIWRIINRGAEGIDSICIVKRILLNYASNMEFKKMFVDEARITSQLHKPTNHPNIIQMIEFQEFENEYLLFLEYVNGREANQIFKKCGEQKVPFPIPYSLYIISEVLHGLYHAHTLTDSREGSDMNIIHRDISPHNILISYSGDVKIIDWGIADAKLKTSHTTSGVVKGKFGYMSPEQASGDKLDFRTDLYSAGIILWELLTGKKLFKHDNNIKILKKIQSGKVDDPRRFNEYVSSDLSTILLKALAKKKENRYSDCLEFSEALTRERVRIAPAFSKRQLSSFLGELFEEEIKKDRLVLAHAEKTEPSEIPPNYDLRREVATFPTQLDRRRMGKPHLPRNFSESRSDRVSLERSLSSLPDASPPPIRYDDIQKQGKRAGKKNVNAYISKNTEANSPEISWDTYLEHGDKKNSLSRNLILLFPITVLIIAGWIFLLLMREQAGTRTLEINSNLKNLTINVAGQDFKKAEPGTYLIERLPLMESYEVEITRPGFETITETIHFEGKDKYTMNIEKMLPIVKPSKKIFRHPPEPADILKTKKSEYRISCKKGSAKGCYNLAVLEYEEGKRSFARKLYSRACSGDHLTACHNLGIMELREGRTNRARSLLKRTCSRGDMDGCNVLGEMELSAGKKKLARSLFQKACNHGSIPACENLQELQK